MKHEFIKPSECNCNRDDQNCPVCDWGFSICKVCGEAEGRLAPECPGLPAAPAAPEKDKTIPHVWYTVDADGSGCRHLAMGREGALQAHLIHFGMMGYSKEIKFKDEGCINEKTDRSSVCMDAHCVLYALSFDADGKMS